jgi:hypothetical protein
METQCERLADDNRRMAKYLQAILAQKGGAA